ncbi:hypothetical protein L9F63_010399, partial [Diploptera punctata]
MCKRKNSPNIYSILHFIVVFSKLTFLASFCLLDKRKFHVFSIICSIFICVFTIQMVESSLLHLLKMGLNICTFSHITLIVFLAISLSLSYILNNIFYKNVARQFRKLENILSKLVSSNYWKYLTNICSIPLFIVIASILTCTFVPGIQLSGILIIIKHLFSSVNIGIKKDFVNNKGSSNLTKSGNKKNKTSDLLENEYSENFKLLKRLKMLLKIYNDLCDIAESINVAYSFVILVLITRMFVGIVHIIYYLITTIMFKNAVCQQTSTVSSSIWLIQHVGIICGFTYISKSLVSELLEFSLQLLHRKLKFTACGFFPIDYTLIY